LAQRGACTVAGAQVHERARLSLSSAAASNFPIALEGALKLKEISYIHAEGYAAGEMKHGPIALIDEHMPVIVLALAGQPATTRSRRTSSRCAPAAAGSSRSTEGDHALDGMADDVMRVPRRSRRCSRSSTVVPLQLLAYYVADLKGTDVDQPRNLAKSVTVE
jgi:glucosamine--fructose-6-phosphate aminotransferase (isomerizing)